MHGNSVGLKHAELTDKIIGVYYDVYNELGYGFLESVYEESTAMALREAGLQVERQVAVPALFRGHRVGDFRPTCSSNTRSFWNSKLHGLWTGRMKHSYCITCVPRKLRLDCC